MAIKKYINTTEVVELTGHTTSEILNLAKTGVLPGHKTRRGWWRFNVEAVEEYFGVQINKPEEVEDKPIKEGKAIPPSDTRLITENFYQEIIKRACNAKSSIKIMTADFNVFRLEPTKNQGKKYKNGTPFMDFLMEKANEGVSVEIISAEKSGRFQDDVERAYCSKASECFSVWFCVRNHAKVVIIDDKMAFIGSANMTRAGLGQPHCSPGNFEVGILTEDAEIISSLNERFTDIKQHKFCDDCHRRKDCLEIKM